jgi:hypothetical protein
MSTQRISGSAADRGGPRRAPVPVTLAILCIALLCLLVVGGCSLSPLTSKSTSERSTGELVRMIRDGERQPAEEAAAVLVVRRDPAAVPGLAEIVRSQSGDPRRLALQALEAVGPKGSAALITELEYEQPDRSRRQLKTILTGWATSDKQTVRLLVAGLGKKYQNWWADDVLVKAGKPAAGPVASAMRSEKPAVAMRCACVLARMKDRRAVPYIVDAIIADRGYGGSTWTAAEALEGPVVERLVERSRGGKGSSRATYALLYWVLGINGRLSKDDKAKAREAVIDALYRTNDTQLGFDMWDEGDPVLTKGAQDWAHSQGKYFYHQGE